MLKKSTKLYKKKNKKKTIETKIKIEINYRMNF